jgi:hypothetical protein
MVDSGICPVKGKSFHEHLMLLIGTHGKFFRVVEQTGVKVLPLTKILGVPFGVDVNISPCRWSCRFNFTKGHCSGRRRHSI